jgi:hypothetical protein
MSEAALGRTQLELDTTRPTRDAHSHVCRCQVVTVGVADTRGNVLPLAALSKSFPSFTSN